MSALRVYRPDECGADGYPFAWGVDPHPEGVGAIKDQVRQQAGHRCVRCHHPYVAGMGEWSPCDDECRHDGPIRARSLSGWVEYEHTDDAGPLMALTSARVEAQWRVLTVHHLTGEKADCRWWNLAALCQRCHLTIQGKVQMARVWPWPHTDWFRPYAAGWYAWTYLGEEITRAEAVERMDELLALEAACPASTPATPPHTFCPHGMSDPPGRRA